MGALVEPVKLGYLLEGPGNATKGSSSIGRAAVSKTAGWGFESLLPCEAVWLFPGAYRPMDGEAFCL